MKNYLNKSSCLKEYRISKCNLIVIMKLLTDFNNEKFIQKYKYKINIAT